MKICTQCRTILYDDDSFCYNCGAETGNSPDEMTRQHNRKYRWLGIVTIAAFAAVTAGGVWQYSRGKLLTPVKAAEQLISMVAEDQKPAGQPSWENNLPNALQPGEDDFSGLMQNAANELQQQMDNQAQQQMQDQAQQSQQQMQDQAQQMLEQMDDQAQQQIQDQAQQMQQQMQDQALQMQQQMQNDLTWNFNMGMNP